MEVLTSDHCAQWEKKSELRKETQVRPSLVKSLLHQLFHLRLVTWPPDDGSGLALSPLLILFVRQECCFTLALHLLSASEESRALQLYDYLT